MATIQVVEEHYHKDYFKKLKFKQQQKKILNKNINICRNKLQIFLNKK